MNSHKAFAALGHKNFRYFWIGQLISLTGTWMHQTAQGWLIFSLTDSPFFLGLAGTASSSPILFFTLAGGVLADRYPKRGIMVIANLVLVVFALVLSSLVILDIVNVWHVLILAFLVGTVHAIEIPTRQSFLIEMVGKKDLLNAIALNSAAFHAARMIGPAIAGFLMAPFGLSTCFLVNALTYWAIISVLLKMKLSIGVHEHHSRRGVVSEFRDGMAYIFSHSNVYLLLISVGIISFFGFPYISFLPVYARDIFKTGEQGLGILMGMAGAGAFSGAVGLMLTGNVRRKGFVMAFAGITFSTALLIFSRSQTVWLSYCMLFLIGFGAINQIATANSLLQLNVPDELRGRVMSAFTTMFLGLAPIGNFVVGSIAHFMGTQQALMIAASLCLTVTLAVIWIRPDILKL